MTTKIFFRDRRVDPVPVPVNHLGVYFEGYLATPREKRWGRFFDDIARQQNVVETVVGEMGFGADGLQVFRGLDRQVKEWRRYTALCKVPAVCAAIAHEMDLWPSLKHVVFAVHKHPLEEMRLGLKKYGAVLVRTSGGVEKKFIKHFQEQARCRVLVCAVDRANVAVRLHQASRVHFLESSWKPELNAAAVLRVHNSEQTRPVKVKFYGAQGSVDAKVQQAMKRETMRIIRDFDPQRVDADEPVNPFD